MDLRIAEAPVDLVHLQPARLPDLFYGEELVVSDVTVEARPASWW